MFWKAICANNILCSDFVMLLCFYISRNQTIKKICKNVIIDFCNLSTHFEVFHLKFWQTCAFTGKNVSQQIFDQLIFEEIELEKLQSLTYLLHCTDWKMIGSFKALLILLYCILRE